MYTQKNTGQAITDPACDELQSLCSPAAVLDGETRALLPLGDYNFEAGKTCLLNITIYLLHGLHTEHGQAERLAGLPGNEGSFASISLPIRRVITWNTTAIIRS